MDDNLIEVKKRIDRIFSLQMNNKWKLRESTADDRIKKLKKIKSCVMKHTEEIVDAIYKDFKKPEEEVLLTEIYPVISEIKHAVSNLHRWVKIKKVNTPLSYFGAKCSIRYEPRGVSLIMSPWNFPFNLALDPLVSAVAAGNTVILKPSEFSPNTSKCIKKILSEVFDESEVAVFEGDYKVSQMLLLKPFDNIFFTGSPQVGKIVMNSASKNLTAVTLELGGKCPVIIDKYADLDEAARRIVWGKCLNAGQICVAPDYLLIPDNREEKFIELAINYINNYYGSMEKPSQDLKYSRIITRKHFTRIKNLIDEAVSKGAKVRFGGYYDESSNFISPTILTDIPSGCRILEEEIFGPVLPVIPYKSIDEAISYINVKPEPLALYVFSRNDRSIDYILDHTQSGDVAVNDVVSHVGNSSLPFGGIGNSGIGKCHGYSGFMAFTHKRSCLRQSKISTMSMLYPPFSAKTKKLIQKVIKYL